MNGWEMVPRCEACGAFVVQGTTRPLCRACRADQAIILTERAYVRAARHYVASRRAEYPAVPLTIAEEVPNAD